MAKTEAFENAEIENASTIEGVSVCCITCQRTAYSSVLRLVHIYEANASARTCEYQERKCKHLSLHVNIARHKRKQVKSDFSAILDNHSNIRVHAWYLLILRFYFHYMRT